MNQQTIRVIYPAGGGQIALRTEEDWDVDLSPVSMDGCVSEFSIETERPFFYFKPILICDGERQWSRGENYLAVATSESPLDVHPYFHENTLKKYPVLYMHDGNNLFLKEEAFLRNTWRTDEVLGVLDRMNVIEEVIVVGIHPRDRMIEYTLPGYEDYGRFLVETLKPLVDAKYRTLSGPTDTAVMGSSLGGVVSFYLGWQWPDVFGKVAC